MATKPMKPAVAPAPAPADPDVLCGMIAVLGDNKAEAVVGRDAVRATAPMSAAAVSLHNIVLLP